MKWALFGASTIADQFMVAAIRAQTHGQVGWIVSGNSDRAGTFAQSNTIENSSTDESDALADGNVEAVYISSTNEKHYAQAMSAIRAGKHVLCEKPLAMEADQAIEMIAAARDAGVTLAVNHHLGSAGSHRAIRDLIVSGAVGKVLSVRVFHAVNLPKHLRGWRLDNPKAGGGVIADLTVHNADTVRFLLNEDPACVIAEMAATGLGQGVEDSTMSVWTMPSDAMVFSHESFSHPFTTTGVEVHGTEGSIIAQGVMAQDPKGEITLVNAEGQTKVRFDTHGLYEAVIGDFEAAVAGGAEPAASGVDGLKSVIIAQAVREAALTGMCQTINYGEFK